MPIERVIQCIQAAISGLWRTTPLYPVSKPWKQPIEKARHGLYGGTHKTMIDDSHPTFRPMPILSGFLL